MSTRHSCPPDKRPLPDAWADVPHKPKPWRRGKSPNHGEHKLPEKYPGLRKIHRQFYKYPGAPELAWELGRKKHTLKEISAILNARYNDPTCTFSEGAIANLFRTLRKRALEGKS